MAIESGEKIFAFSQQAKFINLFWATPFLSKNYQSIIHSTPSLSLQLPSVKRPVEQSVIMVTFLNIPVRTRTNLMTDQRITGKMRSFRI